MDVLAEADQKKILACLSDRWWRLNHLYWITDKYGRKVRFQPNAVQAELDDNLHTLNLVLKSRQHGITTWACIRALDKCLFEKNVQAGIVAHTAGDAAKFFRKKVLYAYDNLPEFIREARPAVRRDMRDGVLELSNGSSIEVSVSHRGGTLQFLHISEYGPMCAMFPERAQEVASGALNAIATGNIVIIESTAYGASGDFYDRCQTALKLDRMVKAGQAVLTPMDYRLHFFGWFQDPINTLDSKGVVISADDEAYFEKIEGETGVALTNGQRAWYVKKAEDQREKMTREHPSTPEEAFAASTEGAYYGKEMAKAEAEGRVLDLPVMPNSPVHTFWDIGHSDTTAIWFMQENGPWFDFIDYYEDSGEQVAHYAKVLQDRGYTYGKHYWPHDGDNTDWSAGEGLTRKQVAEKLKIKPIVIVERIGDVSEGIDMVRQILPRCRFDRTRCGPQRSADRDQRGGLEALRRYHKAWNEKTETFNDHPHHDWSSNGADAFRQCAQGYRTSQGHRPVKPRTTHDSWRTT
jgi:hypothetical protein